MSESETIQKNSKNMFTACQENTDALLKSIKQSVPHYHQSITNVQQEYLQAYEDALDSSIALQEEYVKKVGMTADLPEQTLKVIRDTTEGLVRAASVQNQIALAAIDATQQNIKTFNDNAKSFSDLSRNIVRSSQAMSNSSIQTCSTSRGFM